MSDHIQRLMQERDRWIDEVNRWKLTVRDRELDARAATKKEDRQRSLAQAASARENLDHAELALQHAKDSLDLAIRLSRAPAPDIEPSPFR